jgi:hypothetical protein
MNRHQWVRLISVIFGMYLTLSAHGWLPLRGIERLDSAVLAKLKWLGPLNIAVGLGMILFHSSL